MSESNPRLRPDLGLIGAAVGGIIGFFAFGWISRQGFYALIIPPGLLGLTAGYGVRGRSVPFAVVCGILGLALGLFTEWYYRPFKVDRSFVFFITHLQNLQGITFLMLLIGTVASYRMALGIDRKS